MSFWFEEEEKVATLEELFAFIDCSGATAAAAGNDDALCTVEATESPLILADASSVPPKADCHKSPPQTATTADTSMEMKTHKNTQIRRRKRVGWSSSTGLQRRKRAELQFLRQHVLDLEEFLQQLKVRPAEPFATIKMETPYQWKELASAELAERLRSEKVNHALKGMMNKQLRVHEALRSVVEESVIHMQDPQTASLGDARGTESKLLS
ncbi:hypothetical protein PHYPSEUDO_010696 [Phytophthora pseudosyringae]|uniref:Uncharacterized protein n=1 Tax=Phytophthora pseudosyringae TaxID=221518 RepID=A0A8T1V9P3_9STRA|nr:hypothetical protein PHYPSEUDO_010696 [Phytophthora pseudosyringae]